MKSFFWVALNLIGFVILVFMLNHKYRKDFAKNISQKLFKLMILSIMLFIVFDIGIFLLEEMTSDKAIILNYLFTSFFHLFSIFPCFFYVLYSDSLIFKDIEKLKKRLIIYLLPVLINSIFIFTNPFTNYIFYLTENNLYVRGIYFWIPILLSILYVIYIYPVLIIKSKKDKIPVFKNENVFLFLFPIPPVILTIIQIFNFGILLIGFGFVLAAFLIYINSIQSAQERQSIAVRTYNMNIIQFAVVSLIMTTGMFYMLENAADEISTEYAANNSASTAHILETYLNKEIGVLGTIARSRTIIDWFKDENDIEKKFNAFNYIINSFDVLYNNDIYIVNMSSGKEYSIDKLSEFHEFSAHGRISPNNNKDKWIYDLINHRNRYNLNVDIDKGFQRRRVWLNFKVEYNGELIGVICSGMELPLVVGRALNLNLKNTKSRSFIIDNNGIIIMDSNDPYLFLYNVYKRFGEVVEDPDLYIAIHEHLMSVDGYFTEMYNESTIVRLSTGGLKYAAITPIGTTNWTLITMYDPSLLFEITRLLPVLIIIIVLLILFSYSSNILTKTLIFTPLSLLVESINNMKNNNEHNIYGLERNDEIGLLSNSIKDYFVKGYYDELTGIYNRRYFETTLQQLMTALSRADYKLTLMLIDIDFFKKFNDTYGHGEGDICLKVIAETLNKFVSRKGDFVARYGGEEFVVVLPYTDENGACLLAEKMLDSIRELNVPHKESEFKIVTISIGLTTGINTENKTREDYLKMADEALYYSKRSGRNKYTFLKMKD